LIDGNGGAPVPNSIVIIQGNQITAAGTANQVQAPAGAQVVNANGKWIVPVKPMQVIQAATKWPAEAMKLNDRFGTIEKGKIADLVIVNANPLDDLANLRQIDNVIFDGKIADRGFHAWYGTPFGGSVDDIRAVEDLQWVRRLRQEYPERERGGANIPDPVESPQPAITTISPVMVTQGAPTTTLTISGFNFVARSRVLVDGISVPWKRVSATELAVTL